MGCPSLIIHNLDGKREEYNQTMVDLLQFEEKKNSKILVITQMSIQTQGKLIHVDQAA